MLLPEMSVQTGLVAYELLNNIGVPIRPTISRSDSDSSQITMKIGTK